MALREDQIVRYGRQILLRELGGRGQERLLGHGVRVLGGGPALDDAVAWLLAGGTPVELEPGASSGRLPERRGARGAQPRRRSPRAPPSIELLPCSRSSDSAAQVVVGAGVAFRTAEACDACWDAGPGAQLASQPEPAGVGSLAALAVQRLVLGWAAPLGLVRWTGERFEAGVLPPCPHRAAKPQ